MAKPIVRMCTRCQAVALHTFRGRIGSVLLIGAAIASIGIVAPLARGFAGARLFLSGASTGEVEKAASPAGFGPSAFDVAASISIFQDGSSPTTDACGPPTGSISGKIVLVDRGTCSFESKVENAQDAGAIGVVVANDADSDVTAMEDDPLITGIAIPSVIISKSDGDEVKSAIAAESITARLVRLPARSVTLSRSTGSVVYGRQISMSGAISSPEPQCLTEGGRLLRDVLGGSVTFSSFRVLNPEADGRNSIPFRPDRSGAYRAEIDETQSCASASSQQVIVKVRKRVGLSASASRVTTGGVVRLLARVAPCDGHRRDRVHLYRKTAAGERKIDSRRTNDLCRATFRRQLRSTTTFFVISPKQDPDHEAGRSSGVRIRVSIPPGPGSVDF